MVVLRYFALLLVTILPIHSSKASLPPRVSTSAPTWAWKSMRQCDWNRASYWAERLDHENKDLGTLYRLSWLQLEKKPTQKIPVDEDSDPLLWKPTDELWADENQVADWKSCRVRKNLTFSEIPTDILNELITSKVPQFKKHSTSLRDVLAQYALYEWTQGRSLNLTETELPAEWSKGEQCKWRGLVMIHQKTPSLAKIQKFRKECTVQDPTLSAALAIQEGDLSLKSGLADQALGLFQQVLETAPVFNSPALRYRVAVSALLGSVNDELVFRTASELLAPDQTPPLDPVLQSSLQGLLCERMSALNPKDQVRLFDKIFAPKAEVTQFLALSQACPLQQTAGVAKVLLQRPASQVLTERSRAALISVLLSDSLNKQDRKNAYAHADHLARISKQYPFVASHSFWEGLSQAPKAGSSLKKEIAKHYQAQVQTHGEWLSLDDQHVRSLFRPSKAVVAEQTNYKDEQTNYKKDEFESSKMIRLPISQLLPPLVLPKSEPKIYVHFVEELERAVRQSRAELGNAS